jgi:threonine/homoserine/homoserine lactone efflux protein
VNTTKITNWLTTAVTVTVGVIATMVILALAAKGLASYLSNMNDAVRGGASVTGVALLAYAVATFINRVKTNKVK